MFFPEDFQEKQKGWLLARLESKAKILQDGGERALSHSLLDLVRIRFALQRIEDGQYGLCPHCGGMIEEKRLLIIPETPFCAMCAKEMEQKTN